MVGPRRPECRDMSLSRGAGAYVTYDIDESDRVCLLVHFTIR